MRLRRPHVACLDEVTITREGDAAVISYDDPGVATTHFQMGPDVYGMTDAEILERFNEYIVRRDETMAAYVHVAVEVPRGSPQLKYFELGGYWVPRGDVLRCLVHDGGPGGTPTIEIDDRELSWEEFGRAITSFAGWGMRIALVPDEELFDPPRIEVREPEE